MSNKEETIAMAIAKKCSTESLAGWCEYHGFTVAEFQAFLDAGMKGFQEVMRA